MSETVHYKGIAAKIMQPMGKTVEDVAINILKQRDKKIADYYDNAIECLTDVFSDEYFYHNKTKSLFRITKENHDLEEEIIEANLKENGTIEYELRYYNGGAGFSECLEEAFDKLNY